jgi:peptidoglycan hydrolase-like protein with peptidoglycan-binding domain
LNNFTAALNTVLGTTHNSAAAVNWLQQKLGIAQNGVYDDATKTAVAAYQTSNGLTATGIADTDTINKLNV